MCLRDLMYGLSAPFLAEENVNPLDFEVAVLGRRPMISHPAGVGSADVPVLSISPLLKLRTLSLRLLRRDVVDLTSSSDG